MVSQNEIIPVRIKFSKTGDLMYISHLDLQKTMQRIITRAGIDIWYSEGFNPQPKIVFAVPLPVGVESNCELLDIKINSYMSNEEIMERLKNNLPTQMKVLSVYNPTQKFKNIGYIDYTIILNSPKINESTKQRIEDIFSKECLITKKTKSGEKVVDISPFVNLLEVSYEDKSIKIHTILSADGERYLNPELFVEAIRQNLSILDKDSIEESYFIMRNKMLDFELKEFE